MKITKVSRLYEKFPECDITTKNKNFFIKVGDEYILIHNSPAVIFGINPDDGNFIIGTKRILTKPASSIEEIKQIYSDSPNLQKIFIDLFNYLKPYVKNGIYMGDLMWSPEIIKTKGNVIEFKPNTIIYQVDKNSKLGKEIANKKYGLILHTKMSGPSLKQMSKSEFADIAKFKNIRNIWISNAQRENYSSGDNKDLSQIEKDIIKLESYRNSLDDLGIPITKLQWIFDKINKSDIENFSEKFNMFLELLRKQYKEKALEKIMKNIIDAPEKVKKFISLNDEIIKIKQDILNQLNSGLLFKTFHGNYQTNSGEGFVVYKDDNIVKLVNRKEFSKINAEGHNK